MRLEIDNPKLFDVLVEVLKRCGVVIMPCDTIYGLVGIAPETEHKIRKMKGRQEKSFLRLIPSLQWLSRFTDSIMPPELKSYWPGPLTIIFPSREGGTVALRIPDDPLLLRVMKRLNQALFSTSVNRSGEPALGRIEEICAAFEKLVDLIVAAGDRSEVVPSTIVDITEKPFRLLRHGAVDLPETLFNS